MSSLGNILETTKVQVLTDKSGKTYSFIGQNEREKRSAKMYYYMWLSRLFLFTATLSLALFLSASLALFNLAPRVSVEPFLIINQRDSDDMVRYEPIAHDMASKEKLMEIFVRQYVLYRNTIINDQLEMMSRWYPGGIVHFLSSDPIFEEFNKYRENVWQRNIDEQISQEVEIISVGKVGGKKSPVWKVDFKTYEVSQRNRNGETGSLILNVKYWTASVTSYFFPERLFVGRRLINPLGFTVTRYNQSEVQFQ
ncbi:MAG: type IV secretion system protein [Alphaproteobacteria bacterium]|nr:type IV secretion system protein [Alphaproteobacteria bacterium]